MRARLIKKILVGLVAWGLPALALAQGLTPAGLGIEYGQITGLGTRDVRETVAAIIKVALSLLGVIALVIIIAGGFIWMTAGGNAEKADKARKMIFSGIIGLGIILSAYAIAKFVIDNLVKAAHGQ